LNVYTPPDPLSPRQLVIWSARRCAGRSGAPSGTRSTSMSVGANAWARFGPV